ncbi:MAG: hypothetical protein WCS65_09480 [Verrucomicrobiae bacterium]
MTPSDAIQLSLVSAATGGLFTLASVLAWSLIRSARSERYRRDHYICTRTIRPSTHI